MKVYEVVFRDPEGEPVVDVCSTKEVADEMAKQYNERIKLLGPEAETSDGNDLYVVRERDVLDSAKKIPYPVDMWVSCEWMIPNTDGVVHGPFANLASFIDMCNFDDEPDKDVHIEISSIGDNDFSNLVSMSFYVPMKRWDTYNTLKKQAEITAKSILDGLLVDMDKPIEYLLKTNIKDIVKDTNIGFNETSTGVDWMGYTDLYVKNPLYE